MHADSVERVLLWAKKLSVKVASDLINFADDDWKTFKAADALGPLFVGMLRPKG